MVKRFATGTVALMLFLSFACSCGSSQAQSASNVRTADTGCDDKLNQRPFVPKDYSLFLQAAYPQSQIIPSPSVVLTEDQQKTEMYKILNTRLARGKLQNKTSDTKSLADAIYNDTKVVEKFPNSSLRSAYVMLLGTIGESGMQYFLNENVAVIDFGDTEITAIAHSEVNDGKIKIVFNKLLINSNPALFTPLMAHEILHLDSDDSLNEEVIANYFSVLVYAQQVLADPDLVRQGTLYTQTLNSQLLVWFNSGAGSKISLTMPEGHNVIPNSGKVLRDFYSYIDKNYGFKSDDDHAKSTDGNSILAQYLSNLALDATPQANPPRFDRDTIRFISDSTISKQLNGCELVEIANSLSLSN